MKKIVFTGVCLFITIMFFSGKKITYSSQPPSGYSGVNGFACNACHASFPLNSGGGGISLSGLPLSAGYTPGATYPISVTVSHGTPDRLRWGFELKAVNSAGNPVGVFTAGNGTSVISDVLNNDYSEIAHSPAGDPGGAASSYTFTGFTWQAPQNPGPDDAEVRFYMAGNASNFNFSTDGDYIYTSILAGLSLPVKLSAFTAAAQDNRQVLLQWQTEQESNSSHFSVEKSFDGSNFTETGRVAAKGNSSTLSHYRFTDANPLQYNKAIQYRLKIVDKDGHFQYSPIQSVTLTGRQTVIKTLAPNPSPAGSPITLEIAAWKQETVQIEVLAANGSQALRQTALLNTGYNKLQLAGGSSLKAGIYTILVRSENNIASQRLAIQ